MNNKLLLFFERKSIKYVKIIYIIFMLFVIIGSRFSYFSNYNDFFIKKFNLYLSQSNSELITIATIFIGIYFSVYTILMSSNMESAFGRLSKRNKVSLIKILNEGFISSFLYVIISLFFPVIYNYFPLVSSLTMLGLLILFFYSALVFGLDIFILIKSDIENRINE